MKILFIDIAMTGHHKVYMEHLASMESCESVFVLPEHLSDQNKEYILKSNFKKISIFKYIKYLKNIRAIVENEKPDIIHFLYGDVFYYYFGIGLRMFNKNNVIITFHHVRKSAWRDISVKRIFRKIKRGVVHTKSLFVNLSNKGIDNAIHIEYPVFDMIQEIDKDYAIKKMGLPQNVPVLAAIGGTRYDKGLDILLDALNYVKDPFHLLIAGKVSKFDNEFINIKSIRYSNQVTKYLKYLTNEELSLCINSADYIVLPYRKIFDGASGPLSEGVFLGKIIIGPNHGSIGSIIKENKLGYTFEAESPKDLARAITKALQERLSWNEVAEDYRKELDLQNFKHKYFELYKAVLKGY